MLPRQTKYSLKQELEVASSWLPSPLQSKTYASKSLSFAKPLQTKKKLKIAPPTRKLYSSKTIYRYLVTTYILIKVWYFQKRSIKKHVKI